MPRKKTADKLTSRNEILERLWLSAAKKLLAQLETEGADMSASMFSTITKFLSLNNFNAEALAKVQRDRETRMRMEANLKGNDTASAPPKVTYDYEVPPLDLEEIERIGKLAKQFEEMDRKAAGRSMVIPDATNQ